MFKTGYRKAHSNNITENKKHESTNNRRNQHTWKFCGKRDIEELTSSALTEKYNTPQADIFVLFGGSIICGGDVLAQKIREELN